VELNDVILLRKSVRSWLDKAVESEKLDTVLNAARVAPSAKNLQEWRFVVVTDRETRSRIGEAANNQRFVAEAPVVIACCAETDRHVMRCGQPAYVVDVSIAVDHMTLAAADVGLGTCWIGAFNAGRVKTILGIPDEVELVALLPLGYPKDPARAVKSRLPLEQTVRYEKW
jgi:nitroreductase